VLYPFVSPIDDDSVDKVATICRQHAPFSAEFTAVDVFPGLCGLAAPRAIRAVHRR
jgi:hypothetical protein